MKVYRYFDVLIAQGVKARFRQNRVTRSVQVFQANCARPCSWNEPGYGYGKWTSIRAAIAKAEA